MSRRRARPLPSFPKDACPLCWGDGVTVCGECQGRGCMDCQDRGSEDCPRCEAEISEGYYQAEVALYGRCGSCGQSGAAVVLTSAIPDDNGICTSCEAEDRRNCEDDCWDGYEDEDLHDWETR